MSLSKYLKRTVSLAAPLVALQSGCGYDDSREHALEIAKAISSNNAEISDLTMMPSNMLDGPVTEAADQVCDRTVADVAFAVDEADGDRVDFSDEGDEDTILRAFRKGNLVHALTWLGGDLDSAIETCENPSAACNIVLLDVATPEGIVIISGDSPVAFIQGAWQPDGDGVGNGTVFIDEMDAVVPLANGDSAILWTMEADGPCDTYGEVTGRTVSWETMLDEDSN